LGGLVLRITKKKRKFPETPKSGERGASSSTVRGENR